MTAGFEMVMERREVSFLAVSECQEGKQGAGGWLGALRKILVLVYSSAEFHQIINWILNVPPYSYIGNAGDRRRS